MQRRPSRGIAGPVRRFYAYDERTGVRTLQREPLSTNVVLIFGIDTTLGVDGDPLRTFVGGLGDACPWIEHDGSMAGLQVDLTPLGARMALGVPMHELARRSVELEDVIGGEARALADRLHATSSWDERIDLVTRTLERRLRDALAPPPDVAWAWNRLEETHGRTRISELAATLGCSGKHLAARFREYVGLPPKLIARTMRFRRAAQLLADRPLDEVAYACGYYDQAHLDRDFREFAGATPTAYRRDPRAVTFFQDN